MAKNNGDPARWLNDRLSMLQPDGEWQPDPARGFARLRERRGVGQAKRRRLAWIAAGTAAMLIGLMVFPATRSLAGRYASACVNLLGSLSGSAPKLAYTGIENRKMAPDFALTGRAGNSVKLSDFRGKVVLLDFWTTNCDTCDAEMAWFREFQNTYREQNLVFLDRRVVPGSDDVSRWLGSAGAIPTTLLVDKLGRIAVTHVGLCSKEEYETAIRTLLNEQ